MLVVWTNMVSVYWCQLVNWWLVLVGKLMMTHKRAIVWAPCWLDPQRWEAGHRAPACWLPEAIRLSARRNISPSQTTYAWNFVCKQGESRAYTKTKRSKATEPGKRLHNYAYENQASVSIWPWHRLIIPFPPKKGERTRGKLQLREFNAYSHTKGVRV